MKLYFVRHGESKKNKQGIHQGVHTPLSELGIEQASIVAERLMGKDIDVIFASPFSRAEQTAQIISKRLDLEIEIREELKEVLWPSEIIGLHHSDPRSKKIRQELLQSSHDPDYKYSDEESFNEISKRVDKFLTHLLKHHQDQKVLCVTHGFILKVFVATVLFEEELTSELFFKFKDNIWIDNTGITELDYLDERKWLLHTWNDKTHL